MTRRLGALVPWLLFGLSMAAVMWLRFPNIFTWIAACILLAQLVGSSTEPPERVYNRPDFAVIVTVYNEGFAALVRTLELLEKQTWRATWLIVVDDCSADPAVAADACALFPRARLIRHPVNMGKSEAIASAVREAPAAATYVTIDSDTFIDRHAIEMLVSRVFGDVKAATGLIVASNRNRNLLTRMQDVLYSSAFLNGRAAQSAAGAVLVCSGALSAYDGAVVRRYLDDFIDQRFAGRPVKTGDDRRLTSYALRHGRVVFCPEAMGYTLVPERLGQFLRQQLRWARSWFRESYLAIAEQPLRRPQAYLAVLDLFVWVLFTSALLLSIGFAWWDRLGHLLYGYLAVAALITPARCARYLSQRTDVPMWDRLVGVAVFPAYSLLVLFIGAPMRLYASLTPWNNGWGTRQQGVEVHVHSEE